MNMETESHMTMSRVDLAKTKVKQMNIANYLILMGLSFTMTGYKVVIGQLRFNLDDALAWCECTHEQMIVEEWESKVGRFNEVNISNQTKEVA